MLTRAVILGIAMVLAAALLAPASGQNQRPIDATPFAHAPCSALNGDPCTPTHCSIFNNGPCIPEIFYPTGENLQVTVLSEPSRDDAAKYQKPDHDLGTIGDLFAALRACWSPPPPDAARGGMQMSVLFSFKRSGEIIAAPRLTYTTPGAPAELRNNYLQAIKTSLGGCTPLSFTRSLGGAIAGRPIMVRYVDNRPLQKRSEAK